MGSRPVSRVLSKATIHLGHTSPCDSRDLPESDAGRTIGFLFGLAPGGVYPAVRVTTNAVRSYRTISPLPLNRCSPAELAVYFLWHCPSTRAVQTLSGTLPCGARTFLRCVPRGDPSGRWQKHSRGCPADSQQDHSTHQPRWQVQLDPLSLPASSSSRP